MKYFADLDEIDYAPHVRDDSPVRTLRFRKDHLLFRPYSPRAMTKSGLWLESNPNHPKIWGWALAVARETSVAGQAPAAGAMLVVQRAQGEPIAREAPVVVRYMGHHYAVVALPLAALQLAVTPPLISMEESRVA